MKVTDAIRAAADRLGLDLLPDGENVRIGRHGWSVAVDEKCPGLSPDDTALEHRALAWALYGIRLGLDSRSRQSTPSDSAQGKRSDSPMRFRRTPLRRYHEAPSVHGEHLPVLVARITRQVFEAVSDDAAFCRPWLHNDLEVLIVHEQGKRLDILSVDEQDDSDLSDDERWEKVRSALFYQSYKVRPRQTLDVAGGTLRIFETTEGFGAARALLLPEYDYDAAREYGFFSVPTRDRIIIARPDDQNVADQMLSPLQEATEEAIADSDFALTDAIFGLEPEDAKLLREPGFSLPEHSPSFDPIADSLQGPDT